MPMTSALSRLDLSAYAWKATKMAVGGAVFVAMCLPVAFPSKAGASTALAPVAFTAVQRPAAPAKVQTSHRDDKASHRDEKTSRVKVDAAQVPSKKPLPKTA